MGKTKTGSNTDSKGIPLIEWITASLGAGIILFLIIFLVIEANEGAGRPPNITIEVIKIGRGSSHYNALIVVKNSGDQTAEGVLIKGELFSGDKLLEDSETMFDYVPGESERQGGLMFVNDPHKYKLRIKPMGYEKP